MRVKFTDSLFDILCFNRCHALGALMQTTVSGQGASDETVRDNRFEFTLQGGLAVCLNYIKSQRATPKQKDLAMRSICRL